MDTFGGKPTEGEARVLIFFIAILIFGLGAIFGVVVGHYL